MRISLLSPRDIQMKLSYRDSSQGLKALNVLECWSRIHRTTQSKVPMPTNLFYPQPFPTNKAENVNLLVKLHESSGIPKSLGSTVWEPQMSVSNFI